VSDKLGFAVEMGASNVSTQKFVAISANNNSHVYTVQVPSTSVVVSRELLWHAQFTINVSGTVPDNRTLLEVGLSDALGVFPLSSLCTNLTASINTTTTSISLNRVLDPLLRCMNRKKFAENWATSPCFLDNIGNYTELTTMGATHASFFNSPLGGYGNSFDPHYVPRGAFKVDSIAGNAVNGSGAPQMMTAQITYTVTEPIMLAPFVFSDNESKDAGFHGIQNINLSMSIDQSAYRAFRWYLNGIDDKQVTGINFTQQQCWIEARFLTPHSSDLLPATCITPYNNMVLYPSSFSNILVQGASNNIPSGNIQLNAIPDKVVIFVRPAFGSLKWGNADSYCAINSITINFNNSNGLLSSASQEMLWKYSREAGSSQSWLEYSGTAQATSNSPQSFATVEPVSTTGSVLCLNFGEHIQINEPYYAPGSQGNFNFQVQVNCTNTTGLDMDGENSGLPELNVLVINSGIFVSQNGTSSSYTGILSKQQVLDASLQEPIARTELNRMIGGSFMSRLKAIAKKAMPHVRKFLSTAMPHVAKYAKNELGQSSHPAAKLAHRGLSLAGYGQSGGRLANHLQ